MLPLAWQPRCSLLRLSPYKSARTGGLARKHTLRGYDAVHLATALILREEAKELAESRLGSVESYPKESDEELHITLMSFDVSLVKAASKEDPIHSRQASPAEE